MVKVDEYLIYDETSRSCLRWKKGIRNGKLNNGRLLVSEGDSAGTLDSFSGYYRITIKRTRWQAHRAVWELFHGSTHLEIDHINGVRTDNRISNLRAVSRSENSKNMKKNCRNTTGTTGVTCCRDKFGEVVAYRAEWRENKRTKSRTFTLKNYGESAKILAINYRDEMIKDLNRMGEGYTDSHGKR